MKNVSTNDVLNRLLVLHNRSLPMYLANAVPWTRIGNEHAIEVLGQIVADQRHTVDRIGEMITESGGDVDVGEFPMVFTAYNDISFDFLLGLLITRQKRELAAIEQCLAQLGSAPLAKALAEEARGAALGHLDSLQELQPSALAVSSHGTV